MTKRKERTPGFLDEAERIEREEIQITDEEAEGRWVFVRPRPPKEPSHVYSLRLPATVVEELRVLADAKGEAPTALLRQWLLDRMEQEAATAYGTKPRKTTSGKSSTRAKKTGRKRSAARKRYGASPRSKRAAASRKTRS
jgi:hypothetical protein